MSKTLDLDASYSDIFLNREGELSVAENGREIILTVLQLLRTARGEWNQDTTLGLPFEQELLSGTIDSNIVAGVVEGEILGVQGVRNVTIENIEIENRKMNLDILIETDEGEVLDLRQVELHPSDDGSRPILPEDILAWMNTPTTWLGNNLVWRI